MSQSYILSREAGQDIDDIVDYSLQHFGIDQTTKLIDALEAAYQRIGEDPTTGHTREELNPERPHLRHHLVMKSFRVIFDPNTTPVGIVRILHSAREVGSKL